jgi:hypothetical protein
MPRAEGVAIGEVAVSVLDGTEDDFLLALLVLGVRAGFIDIVAPR